jgi:hypothetical protein
VDLTVAAVDAVEDPPEQNSATQNKDPAVWLGISPYLPKDVDQPANRERTRDGKQYVGEGAKSLPGCESSAEKANRNPQSNRDPGGHAFSCAPRGAEWC